jgi:long-chain acyl-CoA synthetase
MNIAQLLLRAARTFPDKVAVSVGPSPYTDYAGLATKASQLAHALRHRLGLRPGDRIALCMTNCAQYVELVYGAWWAGLAIVPINAKLHEKEVCYILENGQVRACFITADLEGTLGGLEGRAAGLERLISVESDDYRDLFGGEQSDLHTSAPEDTAWLFYTSGTTGFPKGVMLTHRNLLLATLCYFSDVDEIGSADCLLHAAPLSHGSGLYGPTHVLRAANQVIPESGRFDPQEIFALAERWPGMSLFAAPTMVHRLVAHARQHSPQLRGLKTIVYGGGAMYLEDIRAALDVLGNRFVQIYGQGECPMSITALSRDHLWNRDHPLWERRAASVGVPHSAVEVRVADQDDRPLPSGEIGEVLVRGEIVMRGYWGDEGATAAALRDGWLHTGDLGAFDKDGFLTLKDRSKDLIISGGSNIYPREVEEVLRKHPAVSEVSVVGRPHPQWGEEVVAFVVTRTGAVTTETELDRLCLEHIARFKRPKAYRFVAALPKNHYGKVLKTVLRDQMREEDS